VCKALEIHVPEHVAEPEELMGFLLEKAFYPAEQERSR